MTKRAQIITPWTGAGTHDDPNRPQLKDDYTLISFRDVTGQTAENITPDPNAYTVEVVVADAVMQQIEADGTYPVLWSEDVT